MKPKTLSTLARGPFLALTLLLSISYGSYSKDWVVGGTLGTAELDASNLDSSLSIEVWGGVEVARSIWLNFSFVQSGAFEVQGSSAELDVTELRLFMEAQRYFNDKFAIFVAPGFSRFATDSSFSGVTTSFTGITLGANLGFQYNISDTLGVRLIYTIIDDVLDSSTGKLGMDSFGVGIRLEL